MDRNKIVDNGRFSCHIFGGEGIYPGVLNDGYRKDILVVDVTETHRLNKAWRWLGTWSNPRANDNPFTW